MALDGENLEESTTLPDSYLAIRTKLFMDMHRSDTESFATALVEVFSCIDAGESPRVITQKLIDLRSKRAAFERTRARVKDVVSREKNPAADCVSEIDLQHVYQLYAAIAESEAILGSWLSNECDWGDAYANLKRLVTRLPALFDPACDVLLVDGNESECLAVKDFGIKRIVSLQDLLSFDEKLTVSADNNDLDTWVDSLPDISVIPPRVVSGLALVGAESQNENKDLLISGCNALRMSLSRVLTTRNTLNKFGEQWIKNGAQNIGALDKFEDFRSLSGSQKGKTALVVGPAPSLSNEIDTLKRLSESCVIICLSQALRMLVNEGIRPDIVIITDSLYMPADFSSGLGGAGIYAFDIVTDPRHLDMVGDVRLWPYVASEIKAIAFKDLMRGDFLPWLPSGGSVSHSAISLAMSLGFSDIVLVGHDFCLTGDQQYAKCADGSAVHRYGGVQRNVVDVVTNDGQIARAPIDYDIFRKHIEKIVASKSGLGHRFRTASLHGAKIDGVDYVPLKILSEQFANCAKKEEIPVGGRYDVSQIRYSNDSHSIDLFKIEEKINFIFKEGFIRKEVLDGEIFDEICADSVRISRSVPQASLFLQRLLSDIDELSRLQDSDARRRYIRSEFCAALWRVISFQKNLNLR